MRKFKSLFAILAVLLFASVASLSAEDYEVVDWGEMSIKEFNTFFDRAWKSEEGARSVSDELFEGEINIWPMGSKELNDQVYKLVDSLHKAGKKRSKNTVLVVTDEKYVIIAHNSWKDNSWYPFKIY